MENITGKDLYLEDIVVNYSNNFKNNKINLEKLKEYIDKESEYDIRLKKYIYNWLEDKYPDKDTEIRLNTEIINNKLENGIISNRYILKDVNNDIIWNEILPFALKPLAKMFGVEYLYYDNEVVEVDNLNTGFAIEDLKIDLSKYEMTESPRENVDAEYENCDTIESEEKELEEDENSDFMDSLNKLREMGIV